MVSPGQVTRGNTPESISKKTPQLPDVVEEFSLYNVGDEYPSNEHPEPLER
jgi:hypothetical protein